MQCKYIDPKTKKRCNSRFASTDPNSPQYEYCYGHALKLKKISPKAREERNQKISGSHKQNQQEKEIISGAEEVQKKSVAERKAEMFKQAEDTFAAMFETDGFSLKKMVSEAKSDGYDMGKEAKNLFAMWWMAPAGQRSPSSLSDVADLLDITEFKITSWLSEQWFIEKIDDMRLLRMKIAAPIIDRVNIIQAMMGDGKAKDLLYKQIGKLGNNIEEDDPFSEVDEEELEEADEIIGINETKSGTIRPSDDEKILIEAAGE